MPQRIIITADDLGIATEINKGIEESYNKGILGCAALLMNAPETTRGIEIAKRNPGLETGIHLSIVEGLSLRKIRSSITDNIDYFGDISLIRNWKEFTVKFLTGGINFQELEEELELQIIEFLKHFPQIPFLNGTQHLHIFPKVWSIVLKLSVKYQIKAIRTPSLEFPNSLWLNKRLPFIIPFQFLGSYAKYQAEKKGIKTPDNVVGLQFSGRISESVLYKILQHMPDNKIVEIVMHPGDNCSFLRNQLPWGYETFNWETEKEALQSRLIKDFIANHNIELKKFSDL